MGKLLLLCRAYLPPWIQSQACVGKTGLQWGRGAQQGHEEMGTSRLARRILSNHCHTSPQCPLENNDFCFTSFFQVPCTLFLWLSLTGSNREGILGNIVPRVSQVDKCSPALWLYKSSFTSSCLAFCYFNKHLLSIHHYSKHYHFTHTKMDFFFTLKGAYSVVSRERCEWKQKFNWIQYDTCSISKWTKLF